MNLRIDVNGCARCHGNGHKGLLFFELTFPVVDADGTTWTHWAPCPKNGEPVLMLETDVGSETAERFRVVAQRKVKA